MQPLPDRTRGRYVRLLNECGEVMQPGDLRVKEGGTAQTADDNHTVTGEWSYDRGGVAPSRAPLSIQIGPVGAVEGCELSRNLRSEIRCQGGREAGLWCPVGHIEQASPMGAKNHRAHGDQRFRRVGWISCHSLQRL